MSRGNLKIGLAAMGQDRDPWPESSWRGAARAAVAVFLAIIIFVVDSFTALAGAVAVLYCLVLLVAGEGRPAAAIRWSSVLCLILALTGFIKNHGLSLDAAPDFRFLFSVAAILTTAFLLLRHATTRHLHRVQARLLDVTADAIVLRSCDGEVLLWNKGAETLYGWPRDAMIGMVHHDVLRSRFALARSDVRIQMKSQDQWSGEVEQYRRDGTSITVSSRWQLMRTPAGEPWAVLETNTDITAHRAAEKKLQLSERRYRNIFETLAVAVLEYDFQPLKARLDALRVGETMDLAPHYRAQPDLLAALRQEVRVINANETAIRLFEEQSRESFLKHYRHFLPYSDEDFIRCLMALHGRAGTFESPACAVTGKGAPLSLMVAIRFPSDDDGFDCVQASMTDLTESERMASEIGRMRAELEAAMRAATIGEISATIAHEVNQPLAAVKTYAGAARRWLGHEPPNIAEASEALDDAVAAAGSAGEVVKKVRQLFNRGMPETLAVEIDTMITDTLRFAARDIAESAAALSLDLRAGDAVVMGSRALLQQSVLNLTTNALQAMRSTPRAARRLTVRSEVRDKAVVVTVQDSGPGFPSEIVENALDAFFSTHTGGIGLGLAVCRSTILSIGGEIEFANCPEGTGACVTLVLPIEG